MADDSLEQRVLNPLRSGDMAQIAAVEIFPTDWQDLMTVLSKQEAFRIFQGILERKMYLRIEGNGASRLFFPWDERGDQTGCRVQFWGNDYHRFYLFLHWASMDSEEYVNAAEQSIVSVIKILYFGTYTQPQKLSVGFKTFSDIHIPSLSPMVCNVVSQFIAWHFSEINEPLYALNLCGLTLQPECQAHLLRVEKLELLYCRFQAGLVPPQRDGTNIATKDIRISPASRLDPRLGNEPMTSIEASSLVHFVKCTALLKKFAIRVNHFEEHMRDIVQPVLEAVREQLLSFEINIFDSLQAMVGQIPLLFDQILSALPHLKQLHFQDATDPRNSKASILWSRYGSQFEERASQNWTLEEFVFRCRREETHVSPTMRSILRRNKCLRTVWQELLTDDYHSNNPKLLGLLLGKCSEWPGVVYEILCQCSNVLFPSESNDNPPKKRHRLF